jgi:hypothetical protein
MRTSVDDGTGPAFQSTSFVQKTIHVFSSKSHQDLKRCFCTIDRFAPPWEENHATVAWIVKTPDEFGPSIKRLRAQVCTRYTPAQVRGEVQPRCDVNVGTESKGECTFGVSDALYRLEEGHLLCDPVVVDLANGAFDFLDDAKDRLLGDTAALVSSSAGDRRVTPRRDTSNATQSVTR